ncbi:MAG: SRPBCC domain-containing protein [Acidobacteriota bacterium]
MSSPLITPQPLGSAVPFVRQTRLIRASREAVYAAWTEPVILMKWWGPKGNTCKAAELDVREGGALRIVDEFPEGAKRPEGIPREVTGTGVYTEVVPGERLQFTMRASWSPENESLVTVTFRTVEGGTEIVVVQERVQAEWAWAYEAGWASTLDKLDALYPG